MKGYRSRHLSTSTQIIHDESDMNANIRQLGVKCLSNTCRRKCGLHWFSTQLAKKINTLVSSALRVRVVSPSLDQKPVEKMLELFPNFTGGRGGSVRLESCHVCSRMLFLCCVRRTSGLLADRKGDFFFIIMWELPDLSWCMYSVNWKNLGKVLKWRF